MDWTVIITALLSTFSGGLSVAWLSRRKTSAESHSIISKTATDAATSLINEYQEQAEKRNIQHKAATDFLKDELSGLRNDYSELKAEHRRRKNETIIIQKSLENVESKIMKYQLTMSIYSMQLHGIGQEPIIHPKDIETTTIEALREVAHAMSNIEYRRNQIQIDD